MSSHSFENNGARYDFDIRDLGNGLVIFDVDQTNLETGQLMNTIMSNLDADFARELGNALLYYADRA